MAVLILLYHMRPCESERHLLPYDTGTSTRKSKETDSKHSSTHTFRFPAGSKRVACVACASCSLLSVDLAENWFSTFSKAMLIAITPSTALRPLVRVR